MEYCPVLENFPWCLNVLSSVCPGLLLCFSVFPGPSVTLTGTSTGMLRLNFIYIFIEGILMPNIQNACHFLGRAVLQLLSMPEFLNLYFPVYYSLRTSAVAYV